MSSYNPIVPARGDTTTAQVVHLNRESTTRLFNLAKELIETSPETPFEKFGNSLMPLFRKDPFVDGEGSLKTRTEGDGQLFGNEMAEGAMPIAVRFGIGREINWSYTRLGNSFTLTWQARSDNKYQDFVQGVTNLPAMLERRRYLDGTHLFSFMEASSYVNMDGRTVDLTGFDGLPIISGSHTLPFSSDTWDNRIAGNPVVSQASLIAAEKIFREEMKDGFGKRRVYMADTLITSDDPDTVKTVQQLFGSTTEIGQDNPNVINKVTKYKHVMLPYLDSDAEGNIDTDKSKRWILLDSSNFDAYYSEKEPIHMRPSYEEKGNGDMSLYASGAYAYRILSGKGVALSQGTAEAWS